MSYKSKHLRSRTDDYSSDEEYDTVIYEDLKTNNDNDNKRNNNNNNSDSNNDNTNNNNNISKNNQSKESQVNNVILRKKIFHDRKIINDDNNDNDNNNNALKKFIEDSSILIDRNKSIDNSNNNNNNKTNNKNNDKSSNKSNDNNNNISNSRSIDFLELDHNNRRSSYPNLIRKNNDTTTTTTNNNNNNRDDFDFDLDNYSSKVNRNDKIIRKNINKNEEKEDGNNSRKSSLDIDIDRPSHWRSSLPRSKLDVKKDNTKKKRRSDPLLIMKQRPPVPAPVPQISLSSGTQNVSFRPAWIPEMSSTSHQTHNQSEKRVNDDIQENDDHEDGMNDINRSRRSSLEFAAGTIGGNTSNIGASNKGSSPMSGKKRKKAIAGSFASRFQKIARCAENDETRLTNVSIVPSKDPMDPRNRVEFWIDAIVLEEAVIKEPFKLTLITIDALGVNEDRIKAKNQKLQHDLQLDNFNEDNYTTMLLTKFEIGSKIIGYFKNNEYVNTLLQVGQVIRIYEPEICNFTSSTYDNNNNNYDDTCLLCTQLCEILQ